MHIPLNIKNETAQLDIVILGIAEDLAGPGELSPKGEFHLDHGSYPTQEDILQEINTFESALMQNGVKVFRPVNMKNKVQLFTRDLGFVIGDEFFVANMSENRKDEVKCIGYLIELFDPEKIIRLDKMQGIDVEGGDIVLTDEVIYVGLSERTNHAAYEFLKERFKGKRKVEAVKIIIDKNNHRAHALHLDCVFQPLGNRHAIVYKDGIKNCVDFVKNLDYPEENIFYVDQQQFIRMFPNIFSISENTVIIEREFIELKYWLLEKGFKVCEVNFKQISKLNGLLRCATLPLVRK